MHFIVYLSDYVGSPAALDTALQDIVTASKHNNPIRRVTGALFYHKGTFLQAVEGEQENLAELMQVVCADPRHDNIRIVVDEEVAKRSFADWNMDSFNLDDRKNIDVQTLDKFKSVFTTQMKMDGSSFITLLKSVLANPELLPN